MKFDENYEKWVGNLFFIGQTHLVHDTKWGVVGPLKFYKIPLSDHGVYSEGLQTPLLKLSIVKCLDAVIRSGKS